MGAAIDRVDRVCEGVNRLCESIRILQGNFDPHPFSFFVGMNHGMKNSAIKVEVRHEGGDATLEVESHLAPVALI